jgi:hypothetical protein
MQLHTLGETHNHTPIVSTKTIPSFGVTPERTIPIFRFYFDGMIAHFHRHSSDNGHTEGQGCLVVGHGIRLAVVVLPYERSFQRTNFMQMRAEAMTRWPEVMVKLLY